MTKSKKIKEDKSEKVEKKKPFTILEEPMNDDQVLEWWLFTGGIVGVVAGLLLDNIALFLILGSVFGLLAGFIHRAFKKK